MTESTRVWITVETVVNKPVEDVWNYWTNPEHIVNWYFASDDWCAPRAENDVREGGQFLTRMEAKDGSFGFDLTGIYTEVKVNEKMAYSMPDGREVIVTFIPKGSSTKVVETFQGEEVNPVEMQKAGWQAILNNFKLHAEKQ